MTGHTRQVLAEQLLQLADDRKPGDWTGTVSEGLK